MPKKLDLFYIVFLLIQDSQENASIFQNLLFSSARIALMLLFQQSVVFNLLPIPSRAKYLGIPLFMNRNRIDAFIDIKDKIFTKISGWEAKLLSQAARTTLSMSVANAIPTYLTYHSCYA
jgi:hypothetical protein